MAEKGTIIIVDDEAQALESFMTSTLDKGFDYHFCCENPLESIEYVANHKVVAAFLDIRMPNIDGVELAHELLRVSKDIRITFTPANPAN